MLCIAYYKGRRGKRCERHLKCEPLDKPVSYTQCMTNMEAQMTKICKFLLMFVLAFSTVSVAKAMYLDPGENVRVTLQDDGRQIPDCTGKGYMGARDVKVDSQGRWVLFRTRCPMTVRWGSRQQRIADGKDHLYIRDLESGRTVLVSRNSQGEPSNGWDAWASFSSNGRWVAFMSSATNFPDNGDQNGGRGYCVNYPQAIACNSDVYLLNRDVSGDGVMDEPGDISLTLVSKGAGESAYDPTLAGNGDVVAYTRISPGASHIVVWDRVINRRFYVDRAGGQLSNGLSFWSAITNNALKVAFVSRGSNLVPGDTNDTMDLFLWTRASRTATYGTIRRLNVPRYGGQSRAGVLAPSISGDGERVAFVTKGNLSGDDTNGLEDAYVWDARIGHPVLVTTSRTGGDTNGITDSASLSGSGSHLVFTSRASNLVSGDANGARDVFLMRLDWLDTLSPRMWRRPQGLGDPYRVTFKRKPTDAEYPAISNGDFSGYIESRGWVVYQTLQPMVAGDSNDAYDGYIYKLPLEVMAKLRSRN